MWARFETATPFTIFCLISFKKTNFLSFDISNSSVGDLFADIVIDRLQSGDDKGGNSITFQQTKYNRKEKES
jgi:hypothetical protein